MVFLFRSGTYVLYQPRPYFTGRRLICCSFRSKLNLIFKATRTHARNLATFAFLYKATLLLLIRSSPARKEASFHTFLAGLTGGYLVFGRGIQSSVNQQIVTYVFARVVLGLAKLCVMKREDGGLLREKGIVGHGIFGSPESREKILLRVKANAWPVFAATSWAGVMWLFRWYPEVLQASMRSSMVYM